MPQSCLCPTEHHSQELTDTSRSLGLELDVTSHCHSSWDCPISSAQPLSLCTYISRVNQWDGARVDPRLHTTHQSNFSPLTWLRFFVLFCFFPPDVEVSSLFYSSNIITWMVRFSFFNLVFVSCHLFFFFCIDVQRAVYDGCPGAFLSPCRLPLYMQAYRQCMCVCVCVILNGGYIWPTFFFLLLLLGCF